MKSAMAFEIRDAAAGDAAFIARNILAGMGYEVFSEDAARGSLELGSGSFPTSAVIDAFSVVCARPDTLYSWTRTRVACVDGVPAGSLTAYPGDDYLPLRDFTWTLVGQLLGMDTPVSDEPECFPGEFYLDSLAIAPEWRGRTFEYCGSTGKTGHLLMLDGIRIGREKGMDTTSLIVDAAKPGLEAYYSRLGFRPSGRMLFFGEPYIRMRLQAGFLGERA